MNAVLEDYRTAPISGKDKALFALLEKAVKESWTIRQEDVDAAKTAGWTDEALYDAISVCSLFKFYNTWIDATGVHDLPAAAYSMMSKRMAKDGYAPMEPAK
ncbi:MAG: peroxidase [Planctomycetes bacterium]|nr:peroxidase [Planctomycetota bacterium]